MIKKTVSFEDFNGNQVQEDLYFNLSKTEMMDMELSEDGAMSERLKKIQVSENAPAAYKVMKTIILDAYGEKSEDGRNFRKSQEIREDFQNSLAYDAFIWSLFQSTDEITNFINGLVPNKDIQEALDKQQSNKIQLENTEEPSKKPGSPGLTEDQVAEFIRNNPDWDQNSQK